MAFLAEASQSGARDRFRSHVWFHFCGFLQIEAGTERFAGAAQNQNALIRISGGVFDRGCQFVRQLDGDRISALGTIERDDRYLRSLLFDENDWHGNGLNR